MVMNLEEGSSFAILSRFPEHRQRNAVLIPDEYSLEYRNAMASCIKIVRDRYSELKSAGETEWSEPPEMTLILDELASTIPY